MQVDSTRSSGAAANDLENIKFKYFSSSHTFKQNKREKKETIIIIITSYGGGLVAIVGISLFALEAHSNMYFICC